MFFWLVSPAAFVTLVLWSNRGVWGYILRRPDSLSLHSIEAWLRHGLLPLAAAAAFTLFCAVLGRRALGFLTPPEETEPEPTMQWNCVSFAAGLGLCSWGVFLLGIWGELHARGFAALAICGLALARPRWNGAWLIAASGLRPRRSPRIGPGSIWRGLCAGLLAYALWNALARALAPATDWDVLAYHLAIPKLYLRAGGMSDLPWLMHSLWPHLMETLYCLPLALGMDCVAALIHAAACAVLVASVYAAASEEWGPSEGRLAAVLAAAQPLVFKLAGTAHSDGAFALFHFASQVCVWRAARTRGGRGRLAAAGLLAGLAASAKLLGIILMAAAALWIWAGPRPPKPCGEEIRPSPGFAGRRPGRLRWRDAGLFLGIGLAVVAPWYAWAVSNGHNPFWPLFSGLLSGPGANPEELRTLRANYWEWPLPWDLVLYNGPQYLVVPALVLGLAAAPLGRSRFLGFLLWPMIPYALAVFRHKEAWRFCLPFLPALALTAAWGAVRCWNAGPARRCLAASAVAFGLFPILQGTQNNQLFVVLGLKSALSPELSPREAYLERSLDHYRLSRAIRLSPERYSRILLFREIRGYYLEADYVWGDPLNRGFMGYGGMRGPSDMMRRLRELGVSHVLVNEGVEMYGPVPQYYHPRIVALMDETLRARARRVLMDGSVALYELEAPAAAGSVAAGGTRGAD